MSDKILQYQKGDVLVMTDGCYGDYSVVGFLVAIKTSICLNLLKNLPMAKIDGTARQQPVLFQDGSSAMDTPCQLSILLFTSENIMNGNMNLASNIKIANQRGNLRGGWGEVA